MPPPSAFYEKISQEDAQSPNGTAKVTVAEKSCETKLPVVEKVEEKKQKEDPKVRKIFKSSFVCEGLAPPLTDMGDERTLNCFSDRPVFLNGCIQPNNPTNNFGPLFVSFIRLNGLRIYLH